MKTSVTGEDFESRRRLLLAVASASGLALSACAGTRARSGAGEHEEASGEAEVTPGEDLMQEHGVLERILLLYEVVADRLERSEPLDLSHVGRAAGILRRFVEDYHEQLEEELVFPRLESARREVELVAVLRRQHRRGREVTDAIARLADERSRPAELAPALRRFVRMYRPHAAREDTVLFPAFRAVVGRAAYGELGEQFEEREHERLGEHGFEHTVAEVAQLESALEVADLAAFTA